MNNIILDFLEAYKSLDELCKQICSSDRGISEYIDIMEREQEGIRKISGWENEYKRLKNLRRIRNKLVHESGSFQQEIITTEDVEWLRNFHTRILECSDPFALLYQVRNKQNNRNYAIKQEDILPTEILQTNTVQINTISQNESNNGQEYYEPQTDDTEQHIGVLKGIAIFVGIVIGALGFIALAGGIYFKLFN